MQYGSLFKQNSKIVFDALMPKVIKKFSVQILPL